MEKLTDFEKREMIGMILEKGLTERKGQGKWQRNVMTGIAATIAGFMIFGFTFPALAQYVPIVGGIFEGMVADREEASGRIAELDLGDVSFTINEHLEAELQPFHLTSEEVTLNFIQSATNWYEAGIIDEMADFDGARFELTFRHDNLNYDENGQPIPIRYLDQRSGTTEEEFRYELSYHGAMWTGVVYGADSNEIIGIFSNDATQGGFFDAMVLGQDPDSNENFEAGMTAQALEILADLSDYMTSVGQTQSTDALDVTLDRVFTDGNNVYLNTLIEFTDGMDNIDIWNDIGFSFDLLINGEENPAEEIFLGGGIHLYHTNMENTFGALIDFHLMQELIAEDTIQLRLIPFDEDTRETLGTVIFDVPFEISNVDFDWLPTFEHFPKGESTPLN